jgi:hypothetical protein
MASESVSLAAHPGKARFDKPNPDTSAATETDLKPGHRQRFMPASKSRTKCYMLFTFLAEDVCGVCESARRGRQAPQVASYPFTKPIVKDTATGEKNHDQ